MAISLKKTRLLRFTRRGSFLNRGLDGTLKEGYIYPKEDRPLRNLLRKRWHLVKLRTSLMISLKNILSRNFGLQMRSSRIKDESLDAFVFGLPGEDNSILVVRTSKASINFLTVQIDEVESAVLLTKLVIKP